MKQALILILIISAIFSGCSLPTPTELTKTALQPEPASSAPAQTPAPLPAPAPAAIQKPKPVKTQVITIDSGYLFFKPSALTVDVNQPVKINYTNKGKHNFTIKEFGVNISLTAPSGSFTFTPTKKGTFAITCDIPGHTDGGMEGTLTVK